MNGNTLQESRSPLSLIDTSFDRYVKMRQASAQEHMDGGVPDYSFALDEQIRAMPFHYDYLRKLFKKEMGMTPLEYLTRMRMKKAESLRKLCKNH